MNMSGYTKLFSSIVTSTIWNEPNTIRIVWITMLALKDQFGIVEGSIPGLAVLARVTVEECVEAIKRLESPDPNSRTKENEGRRIEKVDGGWRVLNHEKYRDKGSQDERKEYMRKYMKERRKGVNNRKQKLTELTHADTDTKTDTKTDTTLSPEKAPTSSSIQSKGSREDPDRNRQCCELIGGWCSKFKTTFGRVYQANGKDAGAAKRLLATGSTVDEILATAELAWRLPDKRQWERGQALAMSSFAACFNKILDATGRLKAQPKASENRASADILEISQRSGGEMCRRDREEANA